MKSFLAYQAPQKEVHVSFGSWRRTQTLDLSGFIISDANAEKFWAFSPSQVCSLDDLPNPGLAPMTLPAISEEDYLSQASILIDDMPKYNIQKVVYSRIKSFDFDPIFFKRVFQRLCKTYPNNFNYCLLNPETGFWMGSSPEILIQGFDGNFRGMALAGTLPIHEDDSQWTQKEFEEQKYVADYFSLLVQKYGILTNLSERYVYKVGPVKHLRNDFEFHLKDDVLRNFISELHPTPAVCGVPKDLANKYYQQHEKHQRSLYTGIIGFVEGKEIGLYVNLRCMQIFDNSVALYVGGGFTKDSNPQKEWQETERKADTLINLIKFDV
jgi:isochorismate synthase